MTATLRLVCATEWLASGVGDRGEQASPVHLRVRVAVACYAEDPQLPAPTASPTQNAHRFRHGQHGFGALSQSAEGGRVAISYAMWRRAVAGGSDLRLPSNALTRIAGSTVSEL